MKSNRDQTIIRTSIIGIAGNVLLVGFKAFVGFLAGSVSIIMDALNNLTDVLSNGEYQVNPHFAMCNKEINLIGSWAYSAEDYPVTMAFLRQCKEMNIPIEDLITHTFPLDKMNEACEVNVAQQGIKVCYIPG